MPVMFAFHRKRKEHFREPFANLKSYLMNILGKLFYEFLISAVLSGNIKRADMWCENWLHTANSIT